MIRLILVQLTSFFFFFAETQKPSSLHFKVFIAPADKWVLREAGQFRTVSDQRCFHA